MAPPALGLVPFCRTRLTRILRYRVLPRALQNLSISDIRTNPNPVERPAHWPVINANWPYKHPGPDLGETLRLSANREKRELCQWLRGRIVEARENKTITCVVRHPPKIQHRVGMRKRADGRTLATRTGKSINPPKRTMQLFKKPANCSTTTSMGLAWLDQTRTFLRNSIMRRPCTGRLRLAPLAALPGS